MINLLKKSGDSAIVPDSIRSYIINLARCPDRLGYVLPSVAQLTRGTAATSTASSPPIPYQIVPAVDGRELSQEQINYAVDRKAYMTRFKTPPEIGTIGCSLSHAHCLELFLTSDNEFALIFEDDVQFNPGELSEAVFSLLIHKNLWDIVSFELNHHGCPLKIAELLEKPSSVGARLLALVIYLTNVKHAGAYLINRRAAHQLLTNFFPIKMPFDHYFTQQTLFWRNCLKFTGVEPRIVQQKFGTSEIKTPDIIKSPPTAANVVSSAIFYGYSALKQFICTTCRYLHVKILKRQTINEYD